MAVEAEKSTEVTNADATPPVLMQPNVLHGRIRYAKVTHTQAVAGDVLSNVAIAKLPSGKVTLIGTLCNLYVNWTEATVDLDLGWDAYTEPDGTEIVADINGLDSAIDVESAGQISIGSVLAAVGQNKEFNSRDGVTLRATALAAGIGVGDVLIGHIAYVID